MVAVFSYFCTLKTIRMNTTEKDNIIALLKREVVPAIGCTEPMAVALAVAKSKEVLGDVPKQIEVSLSATASGSVQPIAGTTSRFSSAMILSFSVVFILFVLRVQKYEKTANLSVRRF